MDPMPLQTIPAGRNHDPVSGNGDPPMVFALASR
jgi:hypothetical protein